VLGSQLRPRDDWQTLHSPAGGAVLVLQTVAAVCSDARVLLRRLVPPCDGAVGTSGDADADAPPWPACEAGEAPSGEGEDLSDDDDDDDDDDDEEEDDEGEENGREGEDAETSLAVEAASDGGEDEAGGAEVSASPPLPPPQRAAGPYPGPATSAGMAADESSPAQRMMRDRLGVAAVAAPPQCGRVGALLPDSWDDAAEELAAALDGEPRDVPPVVLLCGARNVGKSSFARFLLNRMLAARDDAGVGFLECDVGQPEFTPPGMVALHRVLAPVLGPPHTHLRPHVSACFVGDASPAADPSLYVRCVQRLRETHASAQGHLPLLVNTCGWVGGFGKQLLADVVGAVQPTHLVVFEQANAALREADLGVGPGCAQPRVLRIGGFGRCESKGAADTVRSQAAPAADVRAMQLLAYFDCLPAGARTLPSQADGYGEQRWQRALCGLMTTPPMMVPLHSVRVCVMHGNILPDQVLCSLNASIVGLACIEPGEPLGSADARGSQAERHGTRSPPIEGILLPRPAPACECVGLGLVRSVDVQRGDLFVLTPVPQRLLSTVNTLLRGNIEVPIAMLQPTVLTDASPYLTTQALRAAGANTMKSRNNIIRPATVGKRRKRANIHS
jgi:polynucleotide 5'-kinase involved in rRNA processing